MVTLGAVMVVALLVNASHERNTATSYAARMTAELAVQTGLEAAKKALVASPTAGSAAATADDSFLVMRADGPPDANGKKDSYYFMGKAQTGSVTCYPLFAGGTPAPAPITLNTVPAVQQPGVPATRFQVNPAEDTTTTPATLYPKLYDFQKPAYTQWQEVRDPNDSAVSPAHDFPYQRYTFWVEDLGGYLDASTVGNALGSGGVHQRSTGTNANEIALFTLFDAAQPSPTPWPSPGSPDKKLIDGRTLLLTVPTIKEVAQASGADVTQGNIAVRLGIDTGGERNLVPRGYGYTIEGQLKADLPTLVNAANVAGIASAINRIPGFATRKGGLPTTFDYATNLAANIIDYVKPASAPTTDGSTYRGIGAYPFLVSSYDLNNWVSTGPAPPYPVTIEVTTYVQLWNPHNISVSATANNLAIFHYDNLDKLNVNGATVTYTAPPDLTIPSPTIPSLTLSPNQFKVIAFPIKTYTFPWGPTPPVTTGPANSQSSILFRGTLGSNAVNSLRLTWNGKLADLTYKKMERSASTTAGMRYNPNRNATNAVWRGSAAPPIYPAVGTPGDPRISYYLGHVWTDANYSANSSWGGRLILTGVPQEMRPSTWPDGGHDSTLGKKPTGDSETPISAAGRFVPVLSDANKWISRLSITNALTSITELGNVFDPGQWSYPIPSLNAATNLPDIPTSATADATAGGGYTLNIGKPEFTKFDINGQRAWQLLDVFALGTRTDTVGLVNLNTASTEALRALIAGILLNRDLAALPSAAVYPPKTNNNAKEADLFAQAVIASRPFLSTAQLQTITNANGPYFGNPKQWIGETASSTSSAAPTEWNDSGREELFSKVFGLTTVRSRNFRVFVTGQSLDKSGKVLSTVNKVFQVFLKPQRDATGAYQNQQVEIRYEAFL